MAIRNPSAPPGIESFARQALDIKLASRSPDDPLLGGARLEDMQLTEPHRVYVGRLSDFETPGFLERSRPAGWRYLVLQGGQGALSLEIEAPGDAPSFGELRRGAEVTNTILALESAAKDLENSADVYEIRLYTVPAMYFMALWLAGSTDLLLPIPTPGQPKGLEDFSTYSPNRIWPLLNRDASMRMKADSAPPEEPSSRSR